MPNLGGPELIIVLVVFMLLFGAKRLPELGSSVGKSIKAFKKGIDDVTEPVVDAAATATAAVGETAGADTR
jgi:sec-independent protein translocase protein TatA